MMEFIPSEKSMHLRSKYNEIEAAFLDQRQIKVTLTDHFTFTFIMNQINLLSYGLLSREDISENTEKNSIL